MRLATLTDTREQDHPPREVLDRALRMLGRPAAGGRFGGRSGHGVDTHLADDLVRDVDQDDLIVLVGGVLHACRI